MVAIFQEFSQQCIYLRKETKLKSRVQLKNNCTFFFLKFFFFFSIDLFTLKFLRCSITDSLWSQQRGVSVGRLRFGEEIYSSLFFFHTQVTPPLAIFRRVISYTHGFSYFFNGLKILYFRLGCGQDFFFGRNFG